MVAEPRPSRRRRPLDGRARLATLLLACTTLAGCKGTTSRPEPSADRQWPSGTPIVLVSIDTLRSDRLPIYGYEGVETPAIDALRDDAILFERAFTHIPLTAPAHAALFTGLLPPENGVRDNLGYPLKSAELPYLPRELRALGYRTGAAVSAFVMRRALGFAEGFELYDDRVEFVGGQPLGNLQRAGDATLDVALEWLETVHPEPFFLFLHLYEPHTPYSPPEPYASRYPSAYDGEIAAADAVVGRLLDRLRQLDTYDRAAIVLLSDHGEGLGDHGEQEHEILLYRELLQVPLLLKLPAGSSPAGLEPGSSVAEPAALVDVFPTLVEIAGGTPPAGLAGKSLIELAGQPPRSLLAENNYPRLHFGWSDLTSVIDERYHLIYGPDPELYDYVADPGERNNLLTEERRVFARMREQLESWERSLAAPADVDPETRSKLAALGYVGAVAGETSGPLADPKSKLHVVIEMGRAFDLFQDGEYAAAAEAFRRVVEAEPLLVDAWEHYGKSLRQLGRYDEALAAYGEALELTASPAAALAAADLLLFLGRLDEARQHAELALPSMEGGHDLLAQISLAEDDLTTAESHLEPAVELRGSRIGPLITAAQLRLAQDRPQEAIELTVQAEREFGSRADTEALRNLFFIRGKAHATLGEEDAAAEAFEREIEVSPDALAPYTHLALLHALRGDAASSGRSLQRMVEANPSPEAYAEAVRALVAMGDPGSAQRLLGLALGRWPSDPALLRMSGS